MDIIWNLAFKYYYMRFRELIQHVFNNIQQIRSKHKINISTQYTTTLKIDQHVIFLMAQIWQIKNFKIPHKIFKRILIKNINNIIAQ